MHVSQALDKYRNQMGIPAKLICCNFTASQTSMADPTDAGSLNLVGLDPSIPEIMRQFIVGEI
jgi:60 kDa SS-A/Ro ribonucleoprotein